MHWKPISIVWHKQLKVYAFENVSMLLKKIAFNTSLHLDVSYVLLQYIEKCSFSNPYVLCLKVFVIHIFQMLQG
jgi:hypothetical protein